MFPTLLEIQTSTVVGNVLFLLFNSDLLFLFSALGIKPRALPMASKHSTLGSSPVLISRNGISGCSQYRIGWLSPTSKCQVLESQVCTTTTTQFPLFTQPRASGDFKTLPLVFCHPRNPWAQTLPRSHATWCSQIHGNGGDAKGRTCSQPMLTLDCSTLLRCLSAFQALLQLCYSLYASKGLELHLRRNGRNH